MNTQFGAQDSGYDDEADDELNEHLREPGDPDGVVAQDLRHEQEQSIAAHNVVPNDPGAGGQPTPSKGRWKIVFGVVLVLAAVGAAYYVGSQHKTVPAKKSTATTTPRKQISQLIKTVPTAHYDSTTYGIGIDYPNNWAVSDTTAKLTIISPDVSMETPTSQTNGHVIVTVQNQQSAIAGFPADGAMASLGSDKLTYAQPTPVQRAQTFLSYLGYSSADNLDALYLTGDAGYQQGQTIPLSDVIKGNPLVSVSFATCASDSCANETPKPVVLKASGWKDAAFKPIIVNILQSLAIN